MELDFSKNTYFSQKSQKNQFFAKNAFLAQNSALVWKKKEQIVFKKITSILFLQISKQTSCENPIQIHQEMVYLCYFEDDNVLKWEKQVWSSNRQSYLERATNKWFFFLLFGVEFRIFTFCTWKHTYQRGIWARKMILVKNHQLGHLLVQTFPWNMLTY